MGRRKRQGNSTAQQTNKSVEDLGEMKKINTQFLTPAE
jgi:hypothetical protein